MFTDFIKSPPAVRSRLKSARREGTHETTNTPYLRRTASHDRNRDTLNRSHGESLLGSLAAGYASILATLKGKEVII